MDQSAFTVFASIVTSIVLEAAPFLLLGSFLSAAIAVFVGDDVLTRLGRGRLPAQIALGLAAGLVLPTCECGVVPVVRRLLRKGVPAPTAVAFMLAAPVMNPVSLASTFVAFQGDWTMPGLRALLVLIPAGAMAWAMGDLAKGDLLRPGLDMAHEAGCACGCGAGGQPASGKPLLPRLFEVLRITGGEFLDMGLYLILGACAAALCKSLLPREALTLVAGNPWLAVPAMMLLAVLMSVCSEADAFVAASLAMFPRPALLAFLALGPMLDLKLIPAYLAVFKRRPALAFILAPAAMIYLLCMSLGISGWLK